MAMPFHKYNSISECKKHEVKQLRVERVLTISEFVVVRQEIKTCIAAVRAVIPLDYAKKICDELVLCWSAVLHFSPVM